MIKRFLYTHMESVEIGENPRVKITVQLRRIGEGAKLSELLAMAYILMHAQAFRYLSKIKGFQIGSESAN